LLKYLLSVVVFLLLVPFVNGQNPALTANDWILTELSVNGIQTIPSNVNYLNGQDVVLSLYDTGADYFFDTYVCQNEAIGGTISYPFVGAMSEQFNLVFSSQALGTCCVRQPDITMPPDPDCVALLDFSADYFNFWNDINATYDFEIVSIANTVTLRVTKPNGDFALYNAATASIEDYNHLDIHITQDQISNRMELVGDDVHRIQLINVFDLSGKLIEQLDIEKNFWDTSQFASGLYLLQLKMEDQVTTLKFVKQ